MLADYIRPVPTIGLTDAELAALAEAIRSGSPLPALRSGARGARKVRGGGSDAREGMRATRANRTDIQVDEVFAAFLKLDSEQRARLIARIGDVIDKRARR
jgi:hypothetical protein